MIPIAYDPIYAHPLPEGHRFPMLKYELIPAQLLHEGTIENHWLFAPTPCAESTLLLTHEATYWNDLKNLALTPQHIRRIGFPLSTSLVQRELIITQGTIECSLLALQHGIALNVAGGTHHAFASRGEGFCLLNDVAVAANYLLRKQLVRQILIVDLDVHQGNGSASLFSQEKRVFTFSMHGQHNYPFIKEKSDLDVPLADGTDDDTYLQLLRHHLQELLATVRPDFIFYLSGVDVLATDKFGKLKLSLPGCRQRDHVVLEACKTNQIPCAVAMSGGYSADVKIIAEAHCNTFRVARWLYD